MNAKKPLTKNTIKALIILIGKLSSFSLIREMSLGLRVLAILKLPRNPLGYRRISLVRETLSLVVDQFYFFLKQKTPKPFS